MVLLAPPAFLQFLGHEGLIKVSGKGWWLNTVALTNPEEPFPLNSNSDSTPGLQDWGKLKPEVKSTADFNKTFGK